MITVPDIRQAKDYDCGNAAVDVVLSAFGRPGKANLATAADGLHPATVEATLRQAGLHVQSGRMTVDDLRHHTHLGRLVLCPIALFGGHWVVVTGVARGSVYYHCPTDGPRKVRAAAWVAQWRDSTRAGHPFDFWGIATWGD